MKIYLLCVKALLRYKWYYTWVQTHRIETVDRLFFSGTTMAVVGLLLMFGSGCGQWVWLGVVGVVIVILAKFLVGWAEGKR